MKYIVIINGSGGCGKSTFIELCKENIQKALEEKLPKQSDIEFKCEVTELSTVDFVKDIAFECGWDGTKTEKNRHFLSELKGVLSRWGNVPNKKTMECIKQFNDDVSWVFFVNIREKEEIENFIKLCKEEEYAYSTLLIKNHHVPVITTNVSDANTEDYKYDYMIYNDFDLEIYRHQALWFIGNIIDKMIEPFIEVKTVTTSASCNLDVLKTEKEFNCPDCNHTTNTCLNCMRFQSVFNSNKTSCEESNLTNWLDDFNKAIISNENDSYNQISLFDTVPIQCVKCPSHPINGGTGICHCTLGTTPVIC